MTNTVLVDKSKLIKTMVENRISTLYDYTFQFYLLYARSVYADGVRFDLKKIKMFISPRKYSVAQYYGTCIYVHSFKNYIFSYTTMHIYIIKKKCIFKVGS